MIPSEDISISSSIAPNDTQSSVAGSDGQMHFQKCCKLASIFSPSAIELAEKSHGITARIWGREKSRIVYFSVYQDPCVKELALRLGIPEPTTRTHLVDLERAGYIVRNRSVLPTTYRVSLNPFITSLGKDHDAVKAIRDHFLSADLVSKPHEDRNPITLHSTLHSVAKALQNSDRVKIYREMRNKTAPMILGDIRKMLEYKSEQATCYAVKPLLNAGLVYATAETEARYTQREYVAVPLPFITLINDLNDEFGEGAIIDISDSSKFFNAGNLENEYARNKYYEKTANLFRALRSECDIDCLRWYQRRSVGRMACNRTKLFELSKQNTEFTRIRKLKRVKLLRSVGKEGNAELLKVDWKPLREAINGLID